MNRTALLLLLLAALIGVTPGCTSTVSTEDEILAGTAETAFFVGDAVRFVFWEVPRFFLWRAPKSILYDLPQAFLLTLRGNRAKVEAHIHRLESEDLIVEEEVRSTGDLRMLTGLPIRAAERWLTWWEGARLLPEQDWREAFVNAAIADLESEDYFARTSAIEDLRAIFGTTLDYDPKSGPESLQAGAERWRRHLDARGVPPLSEDDL